MSKAVTNYLQVDDPSKQWVADRVTKLLVGDSVVPSFPDVAIKLCAMVQNESTPIEKFSELISLDTGMASRCLAIASSIGYAARPIDSIQQAVMLMGVQQIRRVALAVATIGVFSEFKTKMDWRRFWLHNVLVARLTDRVAATFRQTNGMEYLAGLLHDVGKLLIERYFAQEFEQIITGSVERQCSHAIMEKTLLGLDHTQIGAAMCDCMRAHNHILRAVRFHHDPLNLQHTSDPLGDGGFLAVCVAIADRLANRDAAYVKQSSSVNIPVEESQEWIFLQRLYLPHQLDLDINAEIKSTEADLAAFFT